MLILGEGATQGLDDTTLTAEAIYPITFTQPNTIFVLSLRCNGKNSFLFVNTTKICQFKAKDSEIKDYALCCKFFDTKDILDIHKYLMRKSMI